MTNKLKISMKKLKEVLDEVLNKLVRQDGAITDDSEAPIPARVSAGFCEDAAICSECKGTGFDEFGSDDVCKTCNGDGIV